MVWTAPRTWVASEVVTAALMNTHVRDNLKAIGDAWTAWTPTVTASTGTFTTVSGSGRYIAAGKLIVWSCTITITTVGTASGYVQFTLPVTAQASSGNVGGGRALVPTTSVVSQVFLSSTTAARVSRYDDSGVIGAGYVIHLSGTYEAA